PSRLQQAAELAVAEVESQLVFVNLDALQHDYPPLVPSNHFVAVASSRRVSSLSECLLVWVARPKQREGRGSKRAIVHTPFALLRTCHPFLFVCCLLGARRLESAATKIASSFAERKTTKSLGWKAACLSHESKR